MMRSARASLAVSALSLVIIVLSLLNQIVIAKTFGASAAFDGYLQATSIPMLVMGAFSSLAAYALIPALIRATSDVPKEAPRITAFFVLVVTVGILIGLAGMLAAPWILRLLTPGTQHSPADGTIHIARIAWACVQANTVIAFATALLNRRGRYVIAIALSSLPYVSTPLMVYTLGPRIGVTAIAWGLASGTFLAAGILLITLRHSFSLRGIRRADFTPAVSFFLAAPLALLSALTFTVYQSIDAYWAPQIGPSSLSILGYSQRLLVALGTVMAAGPSVVLQPRLAAAASRGDAPAFALDLGRALRLTLLICAPVAVGFSILGEPTVRLLFERGAFGRDATLAVAGLLPWMLAGMVPMVCAVMLFKALFARHDVRTAALLGVAGPLLYFFGCGITISRFGLAGVGGAYLLTWVALATVATVRVAPETWGWLLRQGVARELLFLVASTAAPAILMRFSLLRHWDMVSVPGLAARLMFAAVLGVASYLWVGLSVVRVDDLQALARSIRRR